MRTIIPSFLIAALLLGPTPTMGQLPPEILVDSYLLRAERAIRDGDKTRAQAEIDKIRLLQQEHELDLPEELLFRYAKAAVAAGLPAVALETVTKYLTVTGREGPNYGEALELMNEAQDAIAGQNQVPLTSPGPPAPALRAIQDPVTSVLEDAGTNETQKEQEPLLGASVAPEVPPPACNLRRWNTDGFFRMAPVQDVKDCLEAGADPNARGKFEVTPLHWAARSNKNPAVIEALLAGGADPNARDEFETMPLHRAARSNKNPAVIEALLAGGADPNARGKFGATPLHYAARSNENPAVPAVIEALLAGGADPNAWNKHEDTPLHYAAQSNKNPAVIEALLAGGADPNAWNSQENTPLDLARKKNTRASIEILRAASKTAEVSQIPGCKGWNTRKFYEGATIFAGSGKTKDCLAAGANVMARDPRGRTPLHYAAVKGRYRSSRVLIKAGADLEARDHQGRTPLHFAPQSIYGTGKQIKVLLEAGADVSARDHQGWTPLHAASESYELKKVSKLLLKAGADLEARDHQGRTPLHIASSKSYEPEALLKAGANLMARDDLGQTPLHHAAGYIHDSNVKDLIKAGADLEARDNQGRTPLDIAKSSGNRESFPGVARTLIKAGSKPTRRKTGPNWLGAAIGIAGGAAIAAAGGGSEEAAAAGAVFAEGVISGRPPGSGLSGGFGAPGESVGAVAGGQCEIPGYPSPANVKNLGLSWCPATVDFQARAFALQAAGAQCAIATGSSSTPQQIQARRQEIQAACARLAALGVSNCRCP